MEVIKFLIILLSLVTVHELGHFLAAKFFNVYVSEFALGFGPKIFSHQGKETKFSIRALPLGGYAAMVGEDGVIGEEFAQIPHERTLAGVNRFKQFIIMFAGCFLNFVLAFIILTGLAATQKVANPAPVIGNVVQEFPAAKAGLKTDDVVKEIIFNEETIKIKAFEDIVKFNTNNKKGENFTLVVDRNGITKEIFIKPQYDETQEKYISGFNQNSMENNLSLSQTVKLGFDNTIEASQTIWNSLVSLVTGKVNVNQMSGPVGIMKITKEVDDKYGTAGLLNLTAMLSVNLAIFNLLPIPALDGGRILIIAIESITRRKFNEKLLERAVGVSFILLMALIAFVTFNDILNIFK